MKWRWCDMCRFDEHCENQDRNIECACYAREQTLIAEQYSNLIDKFIAKNEGVEINAELQEEKNLRATIGFIRNENVKRNKDCRTLAQKLLQVKPELRDWLEVNFKEYL